MNSNTETLETKPTFCKPVLPDSFIGGDMPIYGINKHINPRKDAKFSPNLWKFLTYKHRHYTNIFQDPKTGCYFIGLREPSGSWCGAKLMRVFCAGNGAETFSYPTSYTATWNDITDWFWQKYLEIGKQIYNLPEWGANYR